MCKKSDIMIKFYDGAKTFAFWVVLCLPLACFSIAVLEDQSDVRNYLFNIDWLLIIGCLSFCAGGFVLGWLYHNYRLRRKGTAFHLNLLSESIHLFSARDFWLSVAFCLIASTFLVWTYAKYAIDRETAKTEIVSSERAASEKSLSSSAVAEKMWAKALENPGGLFAFFTGVLSVMGFYYTIRSLIEIRSTINSFPELIERLCKLTDSATQKNKLKILAYTPAIGAITQAEEWSDFKRKLLDKINPAPKKARSRNFFDKANFKRKEQTQGERAPVVPGCIEMICLKTDHIKIWHGLFANKIGPDGKPVTEEAIKQADRDAEEILNAIAANGQEGKPSLRQLSWRMLPGYYMFFTRTKAIIVTPFFLPFPKGTPKKDQEKLPAVQMIGMETADRAIINSMFALFERYKNVTDSYLASADSSATFDKLQNEWNTQQGAANELEELRKKLMDSFHHSIHSPMLFEEEVKTYAANDSISISLRATRK